MQPPRAGTQTFITDRISVIEQEDKIELYVGIDRAAMDSIEAIKLRNLLTTWKNDKTKRDNKAKYRKAPSQL